MRLPRRIPDAACTLAGGADSVAGRCAAAVHAECRAARSMNVEDRTGITVATSFALVRMSPASYLPTTAGSCAPRSQTNGEAAGGRSGTSGTETEARLDPPAECSD